VSESFRPFIDPDDVLRAAIVLFARKPDLIGKLAELIERERADGKAAALFHHLFIPADGPAFGTEGYLARFRVRTEEEMDVALRALNGDQVVFGGHDGDPSAAMMEAGCREFWSFNPDFEDAPDVVARIWRKMEEAKRGVPPSEHPGRLRPGQAIGRLISRTP
jgi:hypothetical protein